MCRRPWALHQNYTKKTQITLIYIYIYHRVTITITIENGWITWNGRKWLGQAAPAVKIGRVPHAVTALCAPLRILKISTTHTIFAYAWEAKNKDMIEKVHATLCNCNSATCVKHPAIMKRVVAKQGQTAPQPWHHGWSQASDRHG